jgi:hypothetical protein
MGISLRALAPAVGLSVASLFGYRNGSIPVSRKAWSKLEHLEKTVADSRKTDKSATYEGSLNDFSSYLREKLEDHVWKDESLYQPPLKLPQEPLGDSLLPVLERIAKALEMLVEQGKQL